MKKIFLYLSLYFFGNQILHAQLNYVDFDVSMQTNNHGDVLSNSWSLNNLSKFKKNYNNNQQVKKLYNQIPKIIHHIWLGSPFPEKYKAFRESWIKHHPGWKFYLWTDKEVKKHKLINQDLFDKETNQGARSDLVRYEKLLEFGGLYVDTDYECLKPFDIFHENFDFYIGIQPLDTNYAQLGIGLIGCVPNHPFMKKVIKNLRKTKDISQIIVKTGPVFFTEVFCKYIFDMPGKNIAFPASYFYPCGYNQDLSNPDSWKKPESYAVHHWHGSWLK